MSEKSVFFCEKKPELSVVYQLDQTVMVQDGGRMVPVRQAAVYLNFIQGVFETDDPKKAAAMRKLDLFQKGVIVEAKAGTKPNLPGPKVHQGVRSSVEAKAGPAPDESAREVGAAHVPGFAEGEESPAEEPAVAPKVKKKGGKKA